MTSPALTLAAPPMDHHTSVTTPPVSDAQAPEARIREIVAELFIELQLLTYAEAHARNTRCKDLQTKLGALINCPPSKGSHDLLQEATALGLFLQALTLNQEDINDSHLRTVASAADVLEALSRTLGSGTEDPGSDFSVVVLDADEESRSDVSAALVKAGFEAVSFAAPEDTLQFLESSRSDLVVLNVPVPVPSGFDLSKRIRSLELHQQTPILVTLIGTPSSSSQRIFITELALKALNLVHKNRLAATPTVTVPVTSDQFVDQILPQPETETAPTAPLDPVESQAASPAFEVHPSDDPDSYDTTLFLHQAGSIVAAQPSTTALFGWEHEELVGVSVAAVLAQEWQPLVLDYLETHGAGEDQGLQTFHVLACSKDSTQFPVLVTLQRLGSDSSCQWTAGFRRVQELPVALSPQTETAPEASDSQAIFLAVRDTDTTAGEDVESHTSEAVEVEEQSSLAPEATPESELATDHSADPELEQQLKSQQEAALEAQRQAVELADRLASTSAELDNAKAQIAQYAVDAKTSEAESLAKLEAATSATELAQERLAEEISARQQLEAKLTEQQQARQGLEDKAAAQEQLAAKAQEKATELENKFATINSELEGAKADLEKSFAEQERLQGEWMRRFNAVKSAFAQAESAAQQKDLKSQQLSQEVESFKNQLSATQAQATQATQRNAELESALSQAEANLAQAQQQIETAKAERQKFASEKRALEDQNAQLIENLARLREAQQPLELRNAELERKNREGITSLARVTTELENERGERQRAEERAASAIDQLQQMHQELEQHLAAEQATHTRITDLEQALQDRERAATRAEAEAQSQAEERELAEQQLRRMGDLSTRFQEHLAGFEATERAFKQTQEELESQLKSTQASLAEAQNKTELEKRERERLEHNLSDSERRIQKLAADHQAESARVEVALKAKERERKQLERSVLRAEQEAIQASRDSGMQLHNFRRQLRHPMNDLQTSLNQLLEVGLPEDQKKLADAVLENALLLKTLLQQPSAPTS